ncbi:MAG: galactokinase [Chloroflexota bacterium]
MMYADLDTALERVYGADPASLQEQRARYRRALALFAQHYGPGPVTVVHAPGRVNLIGEHTDYNHGFVMPMALDKDVLLLARPRQDQDVRLANLEGDYAEHRFSIAEAIAPQAVGHWGNYLQGPAELLEREHGPGLRGFDGLVDGEAPHGVPRGAGLSSSSALTVAAAAALVDVNGLDLQGAALAELCGRAEWYVGTCGGIMDQFISVLAQRDHALFLDCRPVDGAYAYQYVPIPAEYAVLVVDGRVRHQNTGPHFNRRVAEGRLGVQLLKARYPGITHLRDVGDEPWEELEPLLPEVISATELRRRGIEPDTILDDRGVSPQTDTFYVRRRCRHVIGENRRVLQSVAALAAGDMATFLRLLRAAHASARDDYEISTPEIETLVRLAEGVSERVGARLTGAGWGGCIVVLAPHALVGAVEQAVIGGYRQATGLEARVFACRSAAGAGPVYRTTLS